MSNLVDKISSDYFEARNSLNKSRGEELIVHVENEDDKPFWKDIFTKQGIKTRIYPASRDSLNRGKQEVLKLKDKVGQYMVLCVDSDLDYLLQKSTDISKLINENPYIFQTYTYSIENYKCYSESLHNIVVKSTLQDEPDLFDYVAFLRRYSEEIFELFVYLYHNRINKTAKFSISDFSDAVKLLDKVDISHAGNVALKNLKKQIKLKLSDIEVISEAKMDNYKHILKNLGVTEQNTYLFIQGHTLYDNVVTMILKPIEKRLKSLQYDKISKQKKDNEEANNRRNQYKKSVVDVELVLRNNTDYYNCFLMDKIIRDIQNFKKLKFVKSCI